MATCRVCDEKQQVDVLPNVVKEGGPLVGGVREVTTSGMWPPAADDEVVMGGLGGKRVADETSCPPRTALG